MSGILVVNSKEYLELQRRLTELREEFLNFEIPIDRNPTSIELDKIAAFKLLMHAEIESFIEGRVLTTLTESVNAWTKKRTVSRCLFNLILRWSDPGNDADRFRDTYDGARIDELVERCERRAREEIANNNSIKQEAFLRMCCSAGLIMQECDSTLLAALESFGKTRGEVAHKSVGKVRVLNAPSVEAQFAQNIVALLGQFDIELTKVGSTS